MIWTIIIILWTVFFDSLRDGFLHESWIKRHIFKWLAFYPIIIYLLWEYPWYCFISMAIASWLIWQLGARVICKKEWESWWIKLIKQIIG